MVHDHSSMGSEGSADTMKHESMDSTSGSTAQPTESMTSGSDSSTSSDPSLWDKTKEKASQVKNKVKGSLSK